MSRSTVLLMTEGDRLGAELARQLTDDECEVHLVSPTAGLGNLVSLLLPDVIVANDKVSDAELLKLCRQLRGSISDQHVNMLMMTSANGQRESDGPSRASDEHAAARLAEQIRGWLHCAADLRAQRDVIACDGLVMDRRRFVTTLEGHEVPLTPTEFRLLWNLARHPGQVFSREQLAEIGSQHDLTARPRTIDVHIKSIRRKLEHRGDLIGTVRGVGYRFRAVFKTLHPEDHDTHDADAPSTIASPFVRTQTG
jgi:two-component system, OmpR family, phosphate regulon response regulator PhoB